MLQDTLTRALLCGGYSIEAVGVDFLLTFPIRDRTAIFGVALAILAPGCSSGGHGSSGAAIGSHARSDSGASGTSLASTSSSGESSGSGGSDSGTASTGDGGAGPEAGTDAGAETGNDAGADAGAEPEAGIPVGDGGPDAASCQTKGAGLNNCGMASESCCTSLGVPGGTYARTYTNSGTGATGLADGATVSAFRLDKYLVTVARFRQFVTYLTGSAGTPPANGSGIHTHLNGGSGLANAAATGTYETGWDAADWNADIATGPGALGTWNTNLACGPFSTWTSTAGSQETLPISCLDWYEAYAFCIWDGGFLPSEAEWEYVAAGGSQQVEYPWGSTDPGMGTQYAIYNCNFGMCTNALNSIAPVGTATLGPARWGQLDMAGEMWEWNLDWDVTYVDPCTDCAYLAPASYRTIRGGDFYNSALDLPPPYRSGDPPTTRTNIGIRCARTP
ncbi:MAG: formylglycine-generating enzyme family protein [Polyangiaceae bacterium]